MAQCNPSELLNAARCFNCLSKKELQAVIAQLLCDISTNGMILTSPNGTRYHVVVSDGGAISSEVI